MGSSRDRRDTAREVLRELIAEARRDQLREQAKAQRLRALLRAGKAAGMGVTELAAAANLSRPGIYELLKREGEGVPDNLEDVILAILAAGGATTPTALASTLGVPEPVISKTVERLEEKGAVSFASAGYDPNSVEEVVMLGRLGESLLRQRMTRALNSRSEGWVAYLAAAESEAQRLVEAADDLVGVDRVALIPMGTTFSMNQPELALALEAADEVDLFNQAEAIWYQLREQLSLPVEPMRITAISSPRFRSPVVEALALGIAKARPKAQPIVSQIIAQVAPGLEEATICKRALTEAATALRRAVGQNRPAPELATGDDAFQELQAVVGLHLDPKKEKIQTSLIRALELATDRLGPFPGGQMASLRGPSERPAVVQEINPSSADLTAIAEAAGKALGYAEAATAGENSVADSLASILGLEQSRLG